MRQYSEAEKKVFRRLRKAYRNSVLGILKRRGHATEMIEALQRVTTHAFRIGWLQLPQVKTN